MSSSVLECFSASWSPSACWRVMRNARRKMVSSWSSSSADIARSVIEWVVLCTTAKPMKRSRSISSTTVDCSAVARVSSISSNPCL